jgi:hypothetical protein
MVGFGPSVRSRIAFSPSRVPKAPHDEAEPEELKRAPEESKKK